MQRALLTLDDSGKIVPVHLFCPPASELSAVAQTAGLDLALLVVGEGQRGGLLVDAAGYDATSRAFVWGATFEIPTHAAPIALDRAARALLKRVADGLQVYQAKLCEEPPSAAFTAWADGPSGRAFSELLDLASNPSAR